MKVVPTSINALALHIIAFSNQTHACITGFVLPSFSSTIVFLLAYSSPVFSSKGQSVKVGAQQDRLTLAVGKDAEEAMAADVLCDLDGGG